VTKVEKPVPAGFNQCKVCAYVETGTPEICYACTVKHTERLAQDGCGVCELPLKCDGACENYPCAWYIERRFDRNFAVAMKTKGGPMEKAIYRYKYDGRTSWATIFARILIGYLDAHRERMTGLTGFDMIIPSPTNVDPDGGRPFDHTRLVLERAAVIAPGRWPIFLDEPVIVKTRPTPQLATKKWQEARKIAEGDLRTALRVPKPALTRNKSILVFDDVFTIGFTLREVAKRLREDGDARRVCGITLARQPRKPQTVAAA